ncbi:hypothetical protein A1D29_00705 [Pasteurellaceae bacterium Orientalotternb1]|nr:hypothetical protein A1D29_00705 [Pasteurellaceae bacterium Orientalotternb1]
MKKKPFTPTILSILISLSFIPTTFAAAVRNDVDYQYFRDFAENKGKFFVGAVDVPIYDKTGNLLGTAFKAGVPMLDFSPITRNVGFSTAVAPQYIVSVQHNYDYTSAEFGGSDKNPDAHHFRYLLTGRNNYPAGVDKLDGDYHLPRLHKLITEIVPANVTPYGLQNGVYLDPERFPAFARAGSGLQHTRPQSGSPQYIAWGYIYLIGGVPVYIQGDSHQMYHSRSTVFDNHYGPLVTYAMRGDSGSATWVYDKEQKRWLVYGVVQSNNGDDGNRNTGRIIRADWHKKTIAEDTAGTIQNNSPRELQWVQSSSNSSTINNGDSIALNVPLFDPNLPDTRGEDPEKPSFDHGKAVYFSGQDGVLNLSQNIHQGAGALYFDTNFTVKGLNNDTSWQGAGISVAEGKQVNWQVRTPEGDRLSKIGKGTLTVNGIGETQGEISVGDGTVVLNQQADGSGKKQAFNQLGIVSGRPTVVLGDSQQVPADNIYFGFRGGRLDLNGNDLSFTRIQNVDEGARIVNHNLTQPANITITGVQPATLDQVVIGRRNQDYQDLYLNPKRLWHYLLPKNGRETNHPAFPQNNASDENWEYLGHDVNKAKAIALERKNEKLSRAAFAFNGYIGETDSGKNNGELNVTYRPTLANQTLLLSGGTQLNGSLNVEAGSLVLSGRPVPHAYDHLKKQDVIYEDDWLNRQFNATTMTASNNATLFVGRNVATIQANLTANHNATLNLGLISGVTPECIRSDYTGVVQCEVKTLSEKALTASPLTQIAGNVQLTDNAKLQLSRANLVGTISATNNTQTTLHSNSYWTLTGNSTLGNLDLHANSAITLSNASQSNDGHHQLTINGNLTGNGFFRLLTNIGQMLSDRIVVNGTASGNHQLWVTNSGFEPRDEELELFRANQRQNLNVSLANQDGVVDLGVYRYELVQRDNRYVLAVRHKNGTMLTHDDLPTFTEELVHKNGQGVTAEDLPEAHFKNGQGVTSDALPEAHFKNGQSVTAETLPEVHFKNGQGVTAEALPEMHFKNGQGVTAERLPEIYFKNGKGETTTLPEGKIEKPNQSEIISRYANTALSELSAQLNGIGLFRIGQSLDRQLFKQNSTYYVWSNMENQKGSFSSENYRTYQQQVRANEMGTSIALTPEMAIGAMLSEVDSTTNFDHHAEGKNKLRMLTLFSKVKLHEHFVTQAELGWGKAYNDLMLAEGKTDFQRRIFHTGLTFGFDWQMADFHIQPSIGIRYYRVPAVNYRLNNAEVTIDNLNLVTHQAGLRLTKHWRFGDFSLMPSLASYYVNPADKTERVWVNNVPLTQRFGNYLNHEVAMNAQYRNWEVTAHFGIRTGKELHSQKQWGIQLGYRW